MVDFSIVNFVLIELAEAGVWVKKISNGFLKRVFNRKGSHLFGNTWKIIDRSYQLSTHAAYQHKHAISLI